MFNHKEYARNTLKLFIKDSRYQYLTFPKFATNIRGIERDLRFYSLNFESSELIMQDGNGTTIASLSNGKFVGFKGSIYDSTLKYYCAKLSIWWRYGL